MVDKDIRNAVDEAANLIKENPEMKFYEAIEMAKEMYEKKGPTSSPAK